MRLLPTGEIPNVVCVSNVGCPGLISSLCRVINLKRKEYSFLLNGDFRLLFDPGAVKRMFGENEQELIIFLNVFNNAAVEWLAAFQALGSKVTMYAKA